MIPAELAHDAMTRGDLRLGDVFAAVPRSNSAQFRRLSDLILSAVYAINGAVSFPGSLVSWRGSRHLPKGTRQWK